MILALKDQLGLGDGTVTALEAVNATIGAVLAGLQFAQEITKVVQAVQAATGTAMEGLKSALAFQSTMSSVGAFAAIIVAALILVTALLIFAKLLFEDGDSVAAQTALAQGLATALVVLLLFVISTLFPIGTAIALLVGLLDGIFSAICKIANWSGGKDAKGQTFEDRNPIFCKGIVGNIVAGICRPLLQEPAHGGHGLCRSASVWPDRHQADLRERSGGHERGQPDAGHPARDHDRAPAR